MKQVYCALLVLTLATMTRAQDVVAVSNAGGQKPLTPQQKEQQRKESVIAQKAYELWHHGKLDDAVAEYRKIVDMHGDSRNSFVYYNTIGDILFHQGKIAEAIASYKAALPQQKGAPRNGEPEAYEGLANLYASIGRDSDAIEAYRQIVYRTHDWIDENGQSIKARILPDGDNWSSSRANDPDLLMRYALVLSRTGHIAEALQVYDWGRQAVYKSERDVFTLQMTIDTFDRTLFEAAAHTVIGRMPHSNPSDFGPQYDPSLPEYTAALALAPNYAPAHYYMGNLLAEKYKYAEAKAHWRQAAIWVGGEASKRAKKQLEESKAR